MLTRRWAAIGPVGATGLPGLVAGVLGLDFEAARAGGDAVEVYWRNEATRPAEYHISGAGIAAIARRGEASSRPVDR